MPVFHQFSTGLLVMLIICITWSWYMLANPPDLKHTPFDSTLFKTGDIILFHAYDNINPVFIGSYWGHVGIVYIDPDDLHCTPYLFEALRISEITCCPEYNINGIAFTNLKTRLEKYPGLIAHKPLNVTIHSGIARGFKQFIQYAKKNMYYNPYVVFNGLKKTQGEPYHNGTNCGEITILSLIKLGLLPERTLEQKITHPLLYLTRLETLQNNSYNSIKIIDFNKF
jgi:hypothetical protein